MRSLATEVPDLSTSGTAFKTTENYQWVVHPVKALTVRVKLSQSSQIVAGNLSCATFAVNYSKCKHPSKILAWLYTFDLNGLNKKRFSFLNVLNYKCHF